MVSSMRSPGRHRHTFPAQLSAGRLLFRVRPHVNISVTPLAAFYARPERRRFDIIRIARHVDQGMMPTSVVVAERDQVLHAQLARVAERHRWAIGCLCFGA